MIMLLTLLACAVSFLLGMVVIAWLDSRAVWRKDDTIELLELKNRNLQGQVEWYRAQREGQGEEWKQL